MPIRGSVSESGRFHPRALVAFTFCLAGVGLAMLSFAGNPPNGVTAVGANSSSGSSFVGKETGLYRGMPVTYAVKSGKAILQGDIILEKVESIDPQRRLPSFGVDSFSIDYSQYLWPKVASQYQIPYIITSGSGNLTNLNTALAQFNSTFSNIKFVARTTETDYVNFYFDPNDDSSECEATIGRAGGEQHVGGSGGAFTPCVVGTILHEMGHTVGLWHEQSRPDRNTYISLNYGNLIKGSISDFAQVYDNAQQSTLFDYASIMEYPAFAFTRNGGPVIETIPAGISLSNYAGYSAADIDGIERLYSSAPTAVTVTSNPPGLNVIVDGTTYSTPHVFSNWALNSTHALDIPSGVQSQAGNIAGGNVATTFYYTYGRWNDATAASHTITVLPGNGAPTAPATSPAVTTYSANFIQLVPYAATIYPVGAGTVVPSPLPQSYPGSSLVFYIARQQVTLTATPSSGQNFYAFINGPFYLPGGISANPKTFYVPDTGLMVNPEVEFSPDPVYTINVAPNPFSSNLHIYADGSFYYAPVNYSAFYDSDWIPGSTHTLSLDPFSDFERPYSSNTRFVFNNWSTGAVTNSTSVILPSTSTTYTANVAPQFVVTDSVNETCAGSINVSPGPNGDGFYPSGSVLTFTETPNTGWLFTGWQYDLTGTSNSQFLTITDEVLVAADYNTIATPLTLTSLSPASAVAGGAGFTLTLNGTGFTPSTVVSVKGAFPTVTFINSTQLHVPVTAGQIATPGAFQVWADNFPSGAPCAAFVALPFTVNNVPISTPTPTPTPTVSISGNVSYCSNPVPGPVPGVTLTLTGTMSGSTLSDGSGNYTFSSLTAGGNYTVTPTLAGLIPGSAGINTTDVIAVQRQFLVIGVPLSGCRLTAADVNGDTAVTTTDVIAIQRFFLGLTTGIANVGKYSFTPASRSYPGVVTNQSDQNYDALIFGDVTAGYVH